MEWDYSGGKEGMHERRK